MVSATKIAFPCAHPLASRALSALEFFIGAFIVIGHNVFHVVPNEVIVLCLLGLASIRLRDADWSAMGFKRPASWRRIVLIALAAAALRILLGQFVIEPVTGFFWPAPVAPELANEITGNVKIALFALLIVWTFAAFDEESRVSRTSSDPCSRGRKQISTGLLDWHPVRLHFVWL